MVDEFGLLDHRDVTMILHLAQQGVIVKALGDKHQIQPIDGSTSARIVMDVAARKGAASLDESKRCTNWIELHDRLRQNTVKSECSKKDISELINMLDIRIAHSPADIAEVLETAPPGSEIAVQSNQLRTQVALELPGPPWPENFDAWIPLADGGGVWTGCKVVVRQNLWNADVSATLAQNGETGTITRIGKKTVDVKFEDGRYLTLDRRVAQQKLRIGGVWTGDSAQGQTWDGSSILGITGRETKQWFYSAAARGRENPIIVVLVEKDDDEELVKKWAIETVMNILTHDGIARTVEELKHEALLDKSVPREPGEMVPWLRHYSADLGELRDGIEAGLICVEKPAGAADSQKKVATKIATLFAEIEKTDDELRDQAKKTSKKPPAPPQSPPRFDSKTPGQRRDNGGPAGP